MDIFHSICIFIFISPAGCMYSTFSLGYSQLIFAAENEHQSLKRGFIVSRFLKKKENEKKKKKRT